MASDVTGGPQRRGTERQEPAAGAEGEKAKYDFLEANVENFEENSSEKGAYTSRFGLHVISNALEPLDSEEY